jgi:hypothetical protein
LHFHCARLATRFQEAHDRSAAVLGHFPGHRNHGELVHLNKASLCRSEGPRGIDGLIVLGNLVDFHRRQLFTSDAA